MLDNFSTGSRANLAAVGGEVELVEGDVRSYERTYAATRGIDCVIHLAALPSAPGSIQDPLTTNAVNVTGARSVVLARSSAAWGPTPRSAATRWIRGWTHACRMLPLIAHRPRGSQVALR